MDFQFLNFINIKIETILLDIINQYLFTHA